MVKAAKKKSVVSAKPAIDGRTAAGQRNREALLAAADTLFRKIGYEAVSTREIIALAGVGLGTFYNHFENKEALFRIMLEERSSTQIPQQREYRLQAKKFPDFIRRHYEVFFRNVCEDPANFELFHRNVAAIRESISSPASLQGLAALREDIDAWIASGKVAPMDSEMVASAIMAIAVELGTIVVQREPLDPEGATEFATRLLISGLPWKPPRVN